MSIILWITSAQENASEQISALLQNPQNANSELFLAYLVLAIYTKKPLLLAAFFMSCMLFELSFFDVLSEASLYLITFAIYSYVICCRSLTNKQRLACFAPVLLSIILAHDAYFYGINGLYGTHETAVYNNIEYLALLCHIIVISALIPYSRLRNSAINFVDFILRMSRNSHYY